MKLHILLISILLFLTTSISHADDYVWGEEFKEGDIISAATFNQIFGTLEKINRTVKDSDLLGNWSCNAITTRNTNGWTDKGAFYQLTNSQVTFTSSGSSSSIESPYTISTSAPSPFKRTSGAFSGVYSLFDNMIFTKISGETDSRIFLVDIKSETKVDFIFQETSAQSFPANYASYISCNSAIAVPAAPSATVVTPSGILIKVSWTDQSSDETGFKIYRRLSTETEAKEIATAVTASPYDDSSLVNGQTAYYNVAAYNDNGISAKSKVVSVTLDSTKPTVSSVYPTNNSVLNSSNKLAAPINMYSVSAVFSENVTISEDFLECKNLTTNADCTFILYLPAGITSPGWGSTNTSSVGIYFDPGAGNIRLTVKKDFIKDAANNNLAEDYIWSFTIQ